MLKSLTHFFEIGPRFNITSYNGIYFRYLEIFGKLVDNGNDYNLISVALIEFVGSLLRNFGIGLCFGISPCNSTTVLVFFFSGSCGFECVNSVHKKKKKRESV